ncbi:DNA-directed RNA polymerase subunit beta' [Candidatus Uhrbacteria bacterium RIFCSPHIGHO2_12_FULL_60_25]|uniref:DNA-directed RNA polymerase subunit beta' n=1 Tax=Candidatus Uhrbacteria bacterium RIFCSPHIGHO2_12_FULL_60_25 TaxID=1802399 RepID=A0A1F7UND9_9BACT|nr:MAG: DNA-directed RNA polymerase subunit beta' [Candidatus Uhrbacteria bacterium RIFCSPHIGHO2_02_FULL_60_44]OGL79755.1 MAG: DNA-directed RNA polymerase subunit beta' [Candidatus Uhrbacteria bacterium RIFCSPHIGHO2_12_FULL_60_25]
MSFFQTENIKTTDFDAIRLRLASPETIRGWSYGEVTKPETINYRTQKPEKSGLFAEEIFGPSKDWECYCGKYKKIRYKGIVCDKCGVEVTHSLVRRERMGHIDLAAPVTHIWFLRGVPSKVGTTLDMSVQALEKVIYFAAFIVTDVNEELRTNTIEQLRVEYKSKRKAIEAEYERELARAQTSAPAAPTTKKTKKAPTEGPLEELHRTKENKLKELDQDVSTAEKELKDLKPLKILAENEYHDLSLKYGHVFEAKIGAEAVDELLRKMDVPATVKLLTTDLKSASEAKRDRIIRRLKLLKAFLGQGLDPHWMILKVVPVIPPDLRPMVALDGGRFATSDLNDLYRRVINRNNRLKRLVELNAPEVITRNEKRMLQEAVDSLIDNSARHSKTVIAATGKKRQLKSLADVLKGKQGRFRQNLLGKRIDYSGRSVIVVGPSLLMHQCGIPKTMALELFRPFIISELIKRELVHNIRSANRFIEADHPEVWDILEVIAVNSVVLLNRAPTLHRLGIQGFQPKLIEGRAIQIHPMVCTAFNADFDGDQMAVHVPLTEEARQEARNLMLSTNNLLKPATGQPVSRPDKDIAWGAFYMTTFIEPADGKVKTFGIAEDAVYAYQTGKLSIREKIKTRLTPGSPVIETNAGRVLINRLFPKEVGFRNEPIGTKQLADITRLTLEVRGFERTARFLDEMKELGFAYITQSGFSYGIGDLPNLTGKQATVEDGERRVREIEEQYKEGLLTKGERYSQIIKVWADVKDQIQTMCKTAMDPVGTVYSMIESGARGSIGQLTQVVGMKGLVTNPAGNTIELPIKSSFREGLDVLEYFISSHGTRKGLTDTALKTANAGYLTRRLVDVAQDVVIMKDDCGDTDGVILTAAECDEIGEPLMTRLLGRVTMKDIKDPATKKAAVKKGTLLTEDHIRLLTPLNIQEVNVRSVLTCKMKRGICQQCYGYDLSYNELVKVGTAVGIIAAQSIGEPGTQLTMRTFHTGGVAGADITMGLPRMEELVEARSPKRKALVADVAGRVKIVSGERRVIELTNGERILDTNSGGKMIKIEHVAVQEDVHAHERGDDVKVKDGAKVKEGTLLLVRAGGTELVSEHAGVVKDGKTNLTVIWEGPAVMEHLVPTGYQVLVKDNDEVQPGDALTEGHLDLLQLFKLKGRDAVMRYMLRETLYIYASQGIKLNSKHVEVIIKQMFSRVYIREAGDTDLLPGEVVEKTRFNQENENAGKGEVATGDELFMGITKVALSTESFLSAASFQETAKVLINAAITGKIDRLEGLKENVIIGRLIPAGTGFGHIHEPEPEYDEETQKAA